MKNRSAMILIVFLFSGCSTVAPTVWVEPVQPVSPEASQELSQESAVVTLPIDEYQERRTYKVFGQYVQDRFTGYHVGDDIEYTDTDDDIPVYAIADGTVSYLGSVWGYGGLLMIEHTIDDVPYQALYGHVDLGSVPFVVGDAVTLGAQVAILGEPDEGETSGERKHLHFALYEGTHIQFQGYVQSAQEKEHWIDPSAFFTSHGLLP